MSADGRTVVFSRNDAAQSRLAFLDLHTRVITDVTLGDDRIAQVFSPRWAPDSRRVAFSGWREGGYRDIYVYDRESQQTTRITADRFLDSEPCWTPDGAYILFASDRDDVFNIYAYELESGQLKQVTNVIGGAFEPVVSNDGQRVVYIGFSAQGYDLWTMKLDPAEFFAPLPTSDDLPQADDPTPALPAAHRRPLTLRTRRYQPIRTFFPRVLLPASLDFGSSGQGVDLGLKLDVADVVGFHTLSASFREYFRYGEPVGAVSYTFSQLLPSFSLAFVRDLRVYDDRGLRYNYNNVSRDGSFEHYLLTGYQERQTILRAAVSVPIVRHAIHRASAGLTYEFARLRDLTADREAIDPNAPASVPPAVGDIGSVNLSLRYEATVGAGLPVLDTIDKLHEAGDTIERVEGCLSGTLGFLMQQLEEDVPFSEAVRRAHARGYTEPDPREDLSGMDVARKGLILARTLGHRLELADVAVEALFPPELSDDDPARFIANLTALDAERRAQVLAARAAGQALRYVAKVGQDGAVQVGLQAVPAAAPAGRLRGTDNQIVFYTARYRQNPLVVTGPGAGADVTAAGVLNDILAIARGGG